MSAKVNGQLRNICTCHFLVAEAVGPVYDFCGKTAVRFYHTVNLTLRSNDLLVVDHN